MLGAMDLGATDEASAPATNRLRRKRKFPKLNVIRLADQVGLTPLANVRFFKQPYQPAELLRAATSAPL